MKKIILSILVICIVNATGISQCADDDCNPFLTGASFDEACVEEGTTNTITVDWAMDSGDFICSAPAGSWKIIIQLPQTDIYGVQDVTTTTGPGFDWTYSSTFKNLTGVTNEETFIDFINALDQSAGSIEVITDAKNENTCTPVGTIINIAITPAGEPGSCGQAFENDIGDDVDQSAYGVQPPLPVELLSFEAEREGKVSLLTWVTSTEINNDYFEVQVSRDGKSFTPIGSVKGNGTTYEEQYYEFVHQNPYRGINYYRLKQVDIDKSFSYSDIRTVLFEELENEFRLEMHPNPTTNLISLNANVDVENHKVMIFNQYGAMVRSINFFNGMRISLRDFTAGVYMFKLIDDRGYEVAQKRVIKID